MPSLDLEVRTQLNLALAEAAANQALQIFSRTGDQIASGLGGKLGRALGVSTSPARAELVALQREYAKLAEAEKTAASMAARREAEVEVALRRKVAMQASETATTLESARAEQALVTARNAHSSALRKQESAIIATQAAHGRLETAAVNAGTATENMSRVVNAAGVGSVAAFGVTMAETTKHAADFQEQMIKLHASAGETGEMLGGQFTGNMQTVSNGILQMAGSVGYSTSQLAEAMYTVEKAGFRGSDGLKVLQAAAQGAGAEQADLKEVVDGLTTSMSDFHVQPEQAARLMSQMVTAVGAAKTNFTDFAGALHSVEPAAAAANLKLEDVWGSLAQITQSGTSADQATQNMRNAINAFTGQSQPARDAMAQFGINADDVSQKLGGPNGRGLAGTMQYLYDTISKKVIPNSGLIDQGELVKNAQAVADLDAMITQMSPHAQELATQFKNNEIGVKEFTKAARASGGEDAAKLLQFESLNLKVDGFSKATRTGRDNLETLAAALRAVTGTVAGQSIAIQLSGDATKRTNETIKEIAGTYTDANGNVKGFAESQEGLNAKMRDVKAAFGAAAIEIGETFVPVMTTVANIGKNVADTFARHPAVMHTVVDAVGVLGGAWLGFKALNIAESILMPIATGLGGIIAGEEGATAAAGGLKTVLGGLAGAGAAIGAAAIAANSQSDAMKKAGMETPEEVGQKQGTWAEAKYLFHQTFWADGGAVNGPGPKGKDSVPAWLAPGEHVLTSGDVDAMGGHGNVHAFRNALHRELGGGIGPDVQAAMSMTGTGYSQGSRTDCSGMVARVINTAMGIPGGGLMSTKNAESWLAARGFRPGVGGPGAISVGWYDHGPNPNDGHMAMTLSNGMPAESGGSHGNFIIGSGAAGATAAEFDHHMFLPAEALYGEGPAGMGGGMGMGGLGGGGGFGGMGGFGGGGMGGGAGGFGGGGGGGGFSAADPAKVDAANNRFAKATERLTEAREREAEVLQKANAKQSEKDRAHNQVIDAERELGSAQQAQARAQQGTFHGGRGGRGGGGMGLGTPLPENFGLGKGLPGIAEFLVDWVGDMALAAAAPAFMGMGGADGSDGAALPSLGGIGSGGNMPSLTAADVGAWTGGAMPAAFTGGSGGGGNAPSSSGSAAPSTNALVQQALDNDKKAAAASGQQPTAGAHHGGWFGGDTAGYAPPPAPHDTADYKSWYGNAPDSNQIPGFGRYLPPSSVPPRSPNALGPGMVGQQDMDAANAARLNRQPYNPNLPTPQFGPGGSSMQDMMNAAAQHDWSDKPTYGGLPGAPIFGDDAVHRAGGGPSGTDTVPAWLSPGEFVMNKGAVDRYGSGFMSAVNAGHFFDGGAVYRFPGGPIGDIPTPPPAPPPAPAPAPAPAPQAPTGAPPGIAQALGLPEQRDPNSPQGETVQSGTKSMPFNQGQSSPGVGISGGAGGAAAGMFPGGGLAFALAGRTIGYAGQAAGIGTEALIQTFLPNDSPLANFSNTLPGKMLGAIAGARPAGKNMAGQQTPPQLTKDQVDQQAAKSGGGRGEAPLIGEQHNYGVGNGDEVASALTRAQLSSSAAGRTR